MLRRQSATLTHIRDIGWGFKRNGDMRPFIQACGPMEGVDTFLNQIVHPSGVKLWPDD